MNDDCVTVNELPLEIADYKSNDQEMAAEELERLCMQSYEAYSYLQDRVHDPWLPERAQRSAARIHVYTDKTARVSGVRTAASVCVIVAT